MIGRIVFSLTVVLVMGRNALAGHMSDSELYNHCYANLVYISTAHGTGTGFIAKEDGRSYVYTCEHCIMGGNVAATFSDGAEITLGKLEVAPNKDLVRFEIEKTGKGLALAEESDIGIGDEVVAYGDALGGGVMTANKGKILAFGAMKIEVDSEVQRGNSGGPVLNRAGRVVGVVSSAVTRRDSLTRGTRYDKTRRFAEWIRGTQWISIEYADYIDNVNELLDIRTIMTLIDKFSSSNFLISLCSYSHRDDLLVDMSKLSGIDILDAPYDEHVKNLTKHLVQGVEQYPWYFRVYAESKDVDMVRRILQAEELVMELADKEDARVRLVRYKDNAKKLEVLYILEGYWYDRAIRECDWVLGRFLQIHGYYLGEASWLKSFVSNDLLPRLHRQIKKRKFYELEKKYLRQVGFETIGDEQRVRCEVVEVVETNCCANCKNGYIYYVPCTVCQNGITEYACERCCTKRLCTNNWQEPCKRTMVKCDVCDGNRLIPNKEGRGYTPCTNCVDGSVRCPQCNGIGKIERKCKSCEGCGIINKCICPKCKGQYETHQKAYKFIEKPWRMKADDEGNHAVQGCSDSTAKSSVVPNR